MHRAGRRARLAPSAGHVPQCTAGGRGWRRWALCPRHVPAVSPGCPLCGPAVGWRAAFSALSRCAVPRNTERSALPAPGGGGARPKMAALGVQGSEAGTELTHRFQQLKSGLKSLGFGIFPPLAACFSIAERIGWFLERLHPALQLSVMSLGKTNLKDGLDV